MTEQDVSSERPVPQNEMPGGRTSRGPEASGGVNPDAPIPPYREEKGDTSDTAATAQEGIHKAFDAKENAPAPGSAPPVSKEDREGTSSTDTNPEPALGVGESKGGRAEDRAPDRPDVDEKDGRPVGKTTEESAF